MKDDETTPSENIGCAIMIAAMILLVALILATAAYEIEKLFIVPHS